MRVFWLSPAKPPRRVAVRRLSWSFASNTPSPRLSLRSMMLAASSRDMPSSFMVPHLSVSAAAGAELAHDAYRELEARRIQRKRRSSYAGGHRCRSCHRFVSGPGATCGACGERHGGVFGDAQATR